MFSKIVKPTVNKNWLHRGCSLNVYSTISMNYPPKKFYNINLVIVIPVHFEVRTGSGSFCLLINEVICRSIEPSYHSFFLSLPSIYWSSMSTIKSRLLSFKNESMLALLCSWNNWKVRVGALVQWLWEETLAPKVVGSNPSTVYWMDIFSHLFVVQLVMFVWKDKNKGKRGLGWPFFKKKQLKSVSFLNKVPNYRIYIWRIGRAN